MAFRKNSNLPICTAKCQQNLAFVSSLSFIANLTTLEIPFNEGKTRNGI